MLLQSFRVTHLQGLLPLTFLLSVASLGLKTVQASTPEDQSQRPNIVLFVTDDQSGDIHALGNPAIRTPNLDALAAEGTIFDQAYCTTASCSASRSVILSGLHNHFNGHYGHEHSYHHFSSFERVKSLPVRLTQAGYHTARIGKFHVAPEAVYHFDKALPGNARNPVLMAENVKQHLSSLDGQQPFFLYFCTADPHRGGGTREDLPHSPNAFGNIPSGYEGVESTYYHPNDVRVPAFLPDTPTARAELAMYYESISRIDQGLGRLVANLRELGVEDNTIIIFTSDHGMAFPGAKTTLYEPGMHVPMLVRDPRASQRGITNHAMLSHVDLTPTILDLAGCYSQDTNPAEDFHGRSWAELIGHSSSGDHDSDSTDKWDKVYASHTFHEIQMYYPMKVVHGRQYKLIWNIAFPLPYPFASDLWSAPTWQKQFEQGPETLYGQRTVEQYIHRPEFELFDLVNDPDETRNLALEPEHAQRLQAMQQELKAFQKRTSDPWILKWNYE
ncbi:sulfatase family protein [Aureliella helgolandensis]|uniref:Arylsulfatase n=1 Tax=Aureliella helgolandensis TaxID=2527968 RepID=A0A518G7Z3_9BACT|nr:sulfatase [Aureliella helgolandensis]QDV24705.1 Arylsulfatase [Aureliella helgolandensis]